MEARLSIYVLLFAIGERINYLFNNWIIIREI